SGGRTGRRRRARPKQRAPGRGRWRPRRRRRWRARERPSACRRATVLASGHLVGSWGSGGWVRYGSKRAGSARDDGRSRQRRVRRTRANDRRARAQTPLEDRASGSRRRSMERTIPQRRAARPVGSAMVTCPTPRLPGKLCAMHLVALVSDDADLQHALRGFRDGAERFLLHPVPAGGVAELLRGLARLDFAGALVIDEARQAEAQRLADRSSL